MSWELKQADVRIHAASVGDLPGDDLEILGKVETQHDGLTTGFVMALLVRIGWGLALRYFGA